MKLSIVIPIYRTQDTLDRCIESILRQTFTDYEMILVDDESPDMCPQRCDEYAKQDCRIKVIHKQNGGLSDARNAGLEIAQGEYITFVDSDDSIATDTLQPLMDQLAQRPHIDILEYPIIERVGHPTREHILSFIPKDYHNTVSYWLGEKAYSHTYACNKIFKRKLFEGIRFPKGKNFEDVLTIPQLIGLIPSDAIPYTLQIRVTNVGRYLYYWNNKGITMNAKYNDLLNLYIGQTLSLIQLCKKLKGKEAELLSLYGEAMEDFMTKILNVLLDLYELSGEYETAPPLINKLEWIKQYVPIKTLKLRMLLIFGYKKLCKINLLIHKIYRHR